MRSDGESDTLAQELARRLHPSDEAASVLPGSSLGRYRVVARLGAGGMGVVYAAQDPDLDRRVAVKVLRPEASLRPEARARLLREAKAMAALAHPNVIAVHDVGSLGDQVYLAMELVDGGTLQDWLAERPRSWREVVAMFMQAGRGLAAAHEVGIVHRDFKPENVLIGRDGRARVIDFGLARADLGAEADAVEAAVAGAAGSQAPVTKTGTVLGTPAYMSPEQKHGGRVDARSDQYSFCLALQRALQGRQPPAWLATVIARGLHEAPEQRYPSMAELLAALNARPRVTRWALKRLAVVLAAVLVLAGALWWRAHAGRGRAVVLANGCGYDGKKLLLETYDDRASFEAALGAHRLIDFDDIDTSAGVTAFANDRYARDKGAIVRGTDGQYVDRKFTYPADFVAVSPPNMFAPGPRAPIGAIEGSGGHETTVTFQADGSAACVTGVGITFIDVDFKNEGEPSGITVYDGAGSPLGRALPAVQKNASHQFRGLIVRGLDGTPAPAIARARIVNGEGWAEVATGESSVLDDLEFGLPVPAP